MSLSIIAMALTALIFILCFKKTRGQARNFQAVRDKTEKPSGIAVNGLPGLLIAATVMTAAWFAVSHLLAGPIIALAVPAFSTFLASLQGLGSGAGVVMIVIGVLTTLAFTQLINWLLLWALALILPSQIAVVGAGAAFKAAWRPSLWLTAVNLSVVLLPYLL